MPQIAQVLATVATDTALAPPAVELRAVGLLADPLSVRRLELLLGGAFAIVACAEDAATLHHEARAPMDVAVLVGAGELLARGGAVEQLRDLVPCCSLVMVAKSEDRSLIRKALRAGVDGYVRDCAVSDVLLPTIDAVLAGQLAVPQIIRNRISWRLFSLRERQVLQLVADGLTNGEIAYRLCLSESTVKSHLSSSFRKL